MCKQLLIRVALEPFYIASQPRTTGKIARAAAAACHPFAQASGVLCAGCRISERAAALSKGIGRAILQPIRGRRLSLRWLPCSALVTALHECAARSITASCVRAMERVACCWLRSAAGGLTAVMRRAYELLLITFCRSSRDGCGDDAVNVLMEVR